MRARLPAAGVILISGHIDPGEAASMTRDDFQVLAKPVRLERLSTAIKTGLRAGEAKRTGNVVPLDQNRSSLQTLPALVGA